LKELEDSFRSKLQEVENRKAAEISKIKTLADSQTAIAVKKERDQLLSAARLRAKRILYEANEAMVEAGLEKAREVLKEYSGSESYPRLLVRFINQAKSKLGKNFSVRCRKEDRKFFAGEGIELEGPNLETMGGAIFTSGDGKLELNLTFEELLRIHEDELRAAISSKRG
jgi:vacuolar-type H+-ATPase subunit E/Vma4